MQAASRTCWWEIGELNWLVFFFFFFIHFNAFTQFVSTDGGGGVIDVHVNRGSAYLNM